MFPERFTNSAGGDGVFNTSNKSKMKTKKPWSGRCSGLSLSIVVFWTRYNIDYVNMVLMKAFFTSVPAVGNATVCRGLCDTGGAAAAAGFGAEAAEGDFDEKVQGDHVAEAQRGKVSLVMRGAV